MTLHEHFALPLAWPLLLLVPLAAFLLAAHARYRRRRLHTLLGARAKKLLDPSAERARRRNDVGFLAGLVCTLVAVLQPLWGTSGRAVEQRGIDLVVCLDVSRSMLARDVAPSRLAVARAQIADLAHRARGDRLSLVVFAGDARLLVPLTQDVDAFVDLLQLADPVSVRRGGTDLGAALQCALQALRTADGDHEAVVVVTDGEDHEGRGARAAGLAQVRGITVHTAGVGSARGSKITVAGARGETFLRDKSGSEVLSAMDATSLRALAQATGGEFVDVGASAQALVELYDRRIVPMARKALAADQRRERANRFQWPLAAALVLWLLPAFVGRARARRTAHAILPSTPGEGMLRA